MTQIRFLTRMVVIERRVEHSQKIKLTSSEASNKFFTDLYNEMTAELEQQVAPGQFKRRAIGIIDSNGKPVQRTVNEQWFAIPPPQFDVERIEESLDVAVTLSVRVLAVPKKKSSKKRLEMAKQAAMGRVPMAEVPVMKPQIIEAKDGQSIPDAR